MHIVKQMLTIKYYGVGLYTFLNVLLYFVVGFEFLVVF